MTEIAGKNVLITGGASGIGRLMALKMAHMGGNIILWDINRENLDKTVDEIQEVTGKAAHGYLCDVSNKTAIYEVATKVNAEVGAVDVLVNNAGIVSGKNFLDLPDEKIEQTFKVNTLALFWTAKAFLPQMIARNSGHVITVASSAGLIGVSKLADYCASKWAAIGFDESLRVELKKIAPGVKTTVVCPYYIDTGMFDGVKSRFSFLMPILEQNAVSRKIVKAIQKNRARLWMPPMVHAIPLMRMLPVPVFDAIANILGVNVSMDEFTGHQPKQTAAPHLKEVVNVS